MNQRLWLSCGLLGAALLLSFFGHGNAQEATKAFGPTLENRLNGLSKFTDRQVNILNANENSLQDALNGYRKPSAPVLHDTDRARADALNNVLLPQQLDLIKNNKIDLSSFSEDLKGTLAEASFLSPEELVKKLNSAIVPAKMQELLVLGTDGSRIPPPPHLDFISVIAGGGTRPIGPSTLAPYAVGPGISATVDYPSVANITYSWMGFGQSTLCTGTLISRRAVLTAAHCFCNLVPGANSYRKCSTEKYARGLEELTADDSKYIRVFFQDLGVVDVAKIVINPDYDWPKKDLAILLLANDVTEIMPAPLNEAAALPAGTIATVVGFGQHSALQNGIGTSATAPIQSSQGLKLYTMVKTAKCSGQRASQDLICWNVQQRVADMLLGTTCHGDSGGPLFAKIGEGWMLTGVTSGGLDDCSFSSGPGTQSFNVDLRKSVAWIKRVGLVNPSDWTQDRAAFISNAGLRAASAPYHLFAGLPDTWKQQFVIPANLKSITVSINATPTFSSLGLQVDGPAVPAGDAICKQQASDSYVSCKILNPAAGTWTASVIGSRPQESQLVATIAR